jgi:hypothetical protein
MLILRSYQEFPNKPHWWSTMFTENPRVQEFLDHSFLVDSTSRDDERGEFTVTTFSPEEMGTEVKGWKIVGVAVPGRSVKFL